jgi:CTP:molybdopterin cytidylyltransferase MocA
VDTPLVPEAVYRVLAAADGAIRIPTYGARRGHPLFVSGSVIPAILREPDSSSLREFIRKTGFTQVPVDSENVLLDIDSPADHAELLRRLGELPSP